jgi:succinate dehydrogenase/fumarate reductase-like Fe-S protein
MIEEIAVKLIPIYILSRKYEVPEGSTIITAMEFAGFKLKKGVGCREGFCGACASLYRLEGDYKLHGGLGCQTVIQPNMQIVQIPFTPSPKAIYEIDKINPEEEVFVSHYPEIYRCLSCNTCTKVMDYVQAGIRGDLVLMADTSFDCIMCGLCTTRCPAEITQFYAAMMARRIYGKYLQKKGRNLDERIKQINDGKFEEGYRELMTISKEELKKRYFDRELNFSIT